MAIALRHNFQSAVADKNTTGIIKPSQWNDNHILTLGPNKVVGRTSSGTGNAEELGGEDGIEITGGAIRISAVPGVEGTYSYPEITVNGRGQITAIQNGSSLAYYVELARQYAENPEDVDVLDHPGDFSALHWAAKSEAWVASASAYATEASNSATAALAAQTAAETAQGLAVDALDAFDDIYLGAKAADPALDNDGNALVEGQLYWNTSTNALKVYDGAAWQAYTASGLTAVVDDASPQLGGDLDLNSQDITGTGNINITGDIDATGTITSATIMQGANQVLDAGDIGSSVQAWDAQLDSLSAASANGVSLVTAADYSAMRALLDLEAGTDFLSPAAIAAAYQPLDADLTAIAALTTAAYGRDFLTFANEAAFKAGVNLEANTDFYAPGGTDVALADGGTGASLADPGADRIMFWDDSGSAVTWLEASTGLEIDATTLRMTANQRTIDIAIVIGDGVNAITTSPAVKGYFPVDFAGTVTGWTLVADASGSIVIDVWKEAGAVPDNSDSIAGSDKPTLSSAQYAADASITWTSSGAFSAGDVFGIEVESATTVKQVTLVLKVTKT